MFAVKTKIYGVLYNQASSIAFDETSSYWSALKRYSTFTEKDRNKLNYRIGPLRSDSVVKLVSDLITESDQAVHSCNSWFYFKISKINENANTISISPVPSTSGFDVTLNKRNASQGS